jgi:dephospho-CoA kinase
MILVGLTGGIASGKSFVAKGFRRLGAQIIDADDLAHEAIRPRTPAWKAIVEAMGPAVLHPNRTISRRRLGRAVFSDPAKLRWLNDLIHPYVFAELERRCKEIARKDPKAVAVFDVPLLIETGAHRRMDKIIVVAVDRETQIRRIRSRSRLSRREAMQRIRAQLPTSRKKRLADYVLDGNRPPSLLNRTIRKIYEELKALA